MILNKHKKLFFPAVLLAGMFFYACDKDPEQPILSSSVKATLVVEVMHHQWTVPNIPVYLKKNATEFPGMNTSLYEFHGVANQAGNIQFGDLPFGNYFLFVHGWDPVFNDTVIGYKPVVINDSSATGGIIDDRIYVSE